MAEVDHFSFGAVTPALGYAMSVLGSLLGLSLAARARSVTTSWRLWYLLFAAWAIGGTGIWVMHFVAMLGFGVADAELRYDPSMTTASAIIAVVVVAVGLFIAGLGRLHPLKVVLGGLFAGVGVASMHYTGMAAMRLDGRIEYHPPLVAASVAIAVVAATVALWFAVTVRRPAAIVGSALLMGVAVTGMHYTGMAAMRVHLHDTGEPVDGSPGFTLLRPIMILAALVLVALVYALIAAPHATDEEPAGHPPDLDSPQPPVPDAPPPAGAGSGAASPTSHRRQTIPRIGDIRRR